MKLKKVGLILITLVALAQAGYLTWSYLNRPAPDGEDKAAEFVCGNAGCGAEFTKTRAELVALNAASPDAVPCPVCGKAFTHRAIRCPTPTCRKMVPLVGHGQVPGKCPSCGNAIAMGADGPICPGGTAPDK